MPLRNATEGVPYSERSPTIVRGDGSPQPRKVDPAMIQIKTTRFGAVEIETTDVLRFPAGLIGLEQCQEWVLLADGENDALGWLQSTQRPDLAVAVVSPRRYVPEYQVRVARRELAPLQLEDAHPAQVLVIVGKNDRSITLNLKAPLAINLQRRLGRQMITNGNQPLRFPLVDVSSPLRRSA